MSRFTRALVLFVLAYVYAVYAWLALMTVAPALGQAFVEPFMSEADGSVVARVVTVGLFTFVPAALFAFVWWRGWAVWRNLSIAALVALPIFTYLRHDDAAVATPPLWDTAVPDTPGNRASFEATLWFREGHGPRAAQAWVPGDFALGAKITDEGNWVAAITVQRERIAAEWEGFALGREWIAAMDSHPLLADLTAKQIDTQVLRYGAWRHYFELATARAGLLALDGHGDAAVDELLPLIRVARKLQAGSRTLVRFMSAIVGERSAMTALRFVLAHALVSAAARQAAAAAMRMGESGPAGIARAVWIEYVFTSTHLLERSPLELALLEHDNGLPPVVGVFVRGVGPFVYNPRGTANVFAAEMAQVAEAAAARDLDRVRARDSQRESEARRMRFKNALGEWLGRAVVPPLAKIVAAYWEAEDERMATLARLGVETGGPA